MLDAIARHSLWVAIWLSAVAFIDAVLGGIYRASDGANIGGFIPSSLFSALVFVFAVFVTSALKSGDPRALWWSFGALVAGGCAPLSCRLVGRLAITEPSFSRCRSSPSLSSLWSGSLEG